MMDKNKNWTLIGNPYPCSIDGVTFLAEKYNQLNLTGVLYFLNQSVSNNNDDYVLLNLSGQLSQIRGNYPSGIIARSQGFWVQNSENKISQCIFSNDMKTNGRGVLYAGRTGISRCYLGLENKNNYFNQQLLAFTDEAKINFDKLYDAFIPDTIKAINAFYSLVENKNTPFAIQGLNFNFDTTTVRLGYYSSVSGLMTITLEKLFSFPDSLNVLLQDKVLNTITNLSKNDKYIFNSAIGRFNNRFQILIVPTSQISIEKQNRLLAKWTQTGNNLEINTQSDKIINSISIYNASGQTILSKESVNMTNCNIDLSQYSGVILVEALINGKTEVRKFIVTQ